MEQNISNTLTTLLVDIKKHPQNIAFAQVIEVIEEHYQYQQTSFTNGKTNNASGTNEGSCKIFHFAYLNQLNEQQTLACFGHFYREDVLGNPSGDDHANIRNFINTGWRGINFESVALTPLAR